jgi:hypothetical protein
MYLTQSIDAVQAAVLRLMGPAFALKHSREVRLVATFIYYALTTGSGQQTMGEEYCDVLQRQPQHDFRRQLLNTTSASPTSHLPEAAAASIPSKRSSSCGNSALHGGSSRSGSSTAGPLHSSSSSTRPPDLFMAPTSSLLPRKAALGLTVLQSLGPYLLERLISSLGSRPDGVLGFDEASWLDEDDQEVASR